MGGGAPLEKWGTGERGQRARRGDRRALHQTTTYPLSPVVCTRSSAVQQSSLQPLHDLRK